MTLIRSVVPAALCGLLLITPALGHEGHDHGDAPPVLTLQTAPRASASAPPFELVAVANGNMLTIYLDQYDESELDTSTLSGTAMLLVDGKPLRATLAPSEPGVLSADTGTELPQEVSGAVQITGADGVTAQAKF